MRTDERRVIATSSGPESMSDSQRGGFPLQRTELLLIFACYRARHDETVRLTAQAAQLQAQLAEARLAVLSAQLNPHFLFNTLHAVSSLVERDPRGVRRMIARLSELLRVTLEGTSEQEIP